MVGLLPWNAPDGQFDGLQDVVSGGRFTAQTAGGVVSS